MNLNQIHSITKKICVALLGGFLLIFLLFHAAANLCILRNDDGAWYSAFCHFMGTNYIVKVVEVFLLLFILCHIIITLCLVYTNYKARGTVRYKHPSKTKTHAGSKLMAWTGVLIFVALICHFCDFYFVKMNIVKGEYMVKAEQVVNQEINPMLSQQLGSRDPITAAQFAGFYNAQMNQLNMAEAMIPADSVDQKAELNAYRQNLQDLIKDDALLSFTVDVDAKGMLSEDGKYIKGITYEQREQLEEAGYDFEIEPDFYAMARNKFKNPIISILYLIFFAVIFIHMRHGFPSVFQTLGLNNYTYSKALDVLGLIYAIVVCLMFTATVVGVWFLV